MSVSKDRIYWVETILCLRLPRPTLETLAGYQLPLHVCGRMEQMLRNSFNFIIYCLVLNTSSQTTVKWSCVQVLKYFNLNCISARFVQMK